MSLSFAWYLSAFLVSIHVLRRGRCVYFSWLSYFTDCFVSIHVLRRGRCVHIHFQTTWQIPRFNPRPPKRTLCLIKQILLLTALSVSIHVLRRGRCVISMLEWITDILGVSIHVLRRGRCVSTINYISVICCVFQSTSSEEDVVSLPTSSF